jgi:hypothetical protein
VTSAGAPAASAQAFEGRKTRVALLVARQHPIEGHPEHEKLRQHVREPRFRAANTSGKICPRPSKTLLGGGEDAGDDGAD